MNLHRLRTAVIKTAAGARAAITLMTLATTARRDLVHSIKCGTCGTWVKPSNYNPRYYACTRCTQALAALARADIRRRDARRIANTKEYATNGK